MKLGIGSWTFPWAIGVNGYEKPKNPLTAMQLLERAKEMEVEVVQICDNLPLHTLSIRELKGIREKADELGLVLEIGTRGVEPGQLLRYLDIAKVLQAKLLRTILDTPHTREGIEQGKAWIREVLPRYEEAGVVIAIENHERHMTYELSDIVKELNSPCVGICMDTVNSLGALESPDQVVNALAPYTVCLHIKDFDIKRVDYSMGFIVTGCPAGEGKLDVEGTFKLLRNQGRSFNVILEQWPVYLGTVEESARNEYDWACRSVEFLKSKMHLLRND